MRKPDFVNADVEVLMSGTSDIVLALLTIGYPWTRIRLRNDVWYYVETNASRQRFPLEDLKKRMQKLYLKRFFLLENLIFNDNGVEIVKKIWMYKKRLKFSLQTIHLDEFYPLNMGA